MIRICSVCCAVIGYKEGTGITHGECETCKRKRDAELIRLHNNRVLGFVEDSMQKAPLHPAFKIGLLGR
ncbi:MAG TPA: hypothetical protein PK391_12800 [Syntrophales bacterium]|mgnify:CR=1 FL=1|nr:hypothetical protein [Syntrophales bacterium]